jgi:hypothetical protein
MYVSIILYIYNRILVSVCEFIKLICMYKIWLIIMLKYTHPAFSEYYQCLIYIFLFAIAEKMKFVKRHVVYVYHLNRFVDCIYTMRIVFTQA